MDNNMQKAYSENGTLIVSVSTASGAIPIEGAIITIRDSSKANSGVLSIHYTDKSGNTEKIKLPAPPAAMSEVPGNISPYAEYNIEVDKEGFNSRGFINVPIFAGTTSIQPVNLIPKTEYEGESVIPNNGTVTESQNPEL